MLKKKQKLLSDKIVDVIAPRKLLDPEIDSEDETAAKARDYEFDEDIDNIDAQQSLSAIRKRNVKLLHDVDAKYRGKVTSRKKLGIDSEESSHSDGDDVNGENGTVSEDDENNKEDLDGLLQESDEDEDDDDIEEGDDDGGEDEDEEDDDDDGENYENSEESDEEMDDEEESDFDGGDIISRDTNEVESESNLLKPLSDDHYLRSFSVQNQLKIWEKLLEVRINSQKSLIKANTLPTYDKFSQLAESNPEYKKLANETANNAARLLFQMQELETSLLSQFPETKSLAVKRKHEWTSSKDREAKVMKLEEELKDSFNTFKPYRNSVISKWHDHTKLLTPGNVKSQQQHGNVDILRRIEDTLANADDLIKKSQLVKGNYQLFDSNSNESETTNGEGGGKTEVYCSEIYDDTDFYHAMLRELIEYKTNTSQSSSEVAKKFAELQTLRNKMKKTVDTRASKGRKIRYTVHKKLISFMAPNEPNKWTDESKTELYRSLFGAQA